MSGTTDKKTQKTLLTELGITPQEMDDYITACELSPDLEEYSPEQVHLLYQYHRLCSFKDIKETLLNSYHQSIGNGTPVLDALRETLELVRDQESKNSSQPPSTSTQWVNEPVSLLALLGLAEDLTSKPMTLSRGLEILEACGLKEQPQYQPDMANRFLDAVDRVTNLGESLGAISTENGVTQGASGMDWLQTASKVDAQQIAGLMQDEGTQTAVELTTTYRQMVLSKVRDSFVNGQVNQAYVEGQQQLLGDNARWDAVREQLRKDREAMGLGGRSYVIDVTPTESLSSQNQAQLPQGEQEG